MVATRWRLVELMPVQSLDGNEAPYDRLVKFLAAGDFEAAGIDAPFSQPLAHMPPADMEARMATWRLKIRRYLCRQRGL